LVAQNQPEGELAALESGRAAALDHAAALVRAIRRAHRSPSGFDSVEAFHIHNVHEFAARLVAEGVRASEVGP
jgi:hypothetical protein